MFERFVEWCARRRGLMLAFVVVLSLRLAKYMDKGNPN